MRGTLNEMALPEAPGLESDEYLAENIDKFGGPEGYNHYAIGWAHAMCTPYQWTKQIASHWGGTRNGTIVHWPAGIKANGELRNQFCHITDIAPTVLDLAGLPEPTTVNGITQEPMHARAWPTASRTQMPVSATTPSTSRSSATAASTTAVGQRSPAITSPGNKPAAADHSTTTCGSSTTERRTGPKHTMFSAEHPEKLAELQRLFLIEAAKYNVLPLDPRMAARFNAELAGRPQLITGNSLVLFPGMRSLTENTMINLKNKSHSITAEIAIPDDGAEGVLINQGGITGGWSLYLKDGALSYHYSFIGLEHTTVSATDPLAAGEHQVRMEFAYDGGGLGKGGTATLYVDGEESGSGRVERTHGFVFSLDETTDVGCDTGSPVCDDYPAVDNRFTGTINSIRVDVGDDSHDHLIDPNQLMRLAMSRQ